MATQLHTRLLSGVELMMLTSMCTLQAVQASPQAPLHVDDLKVKEGQRPRTNMSVANRLLMSHLDLAGDDKLKERQQVQLGCRFLIICITCNATLQLACISSVTHIHC